MVLILDDHAGGRRLREWNFLAKDAFAWIFFWLCVGLWFLKKLCEGQGAEVDTPRPRRNVPNMLSRHERLSGT